MTEKGIWNYDHSAKELVLKERNILEEWTDFSAMYGRANKVIFYIKQLTENELEWCVNKENKQSCYTYNKDRTYITANSDRIFYQELAEEFTGTGSQKKKILLSGYETELKLSYQFYKEVDQLTITDKSGKELFSTEMTATNGRRTKEIPLRGVTKLVFKVTSSEASSKWKFSVKVK